MREKIELLKTRDFGEIIGDTFVFIKENFKPLFKNLIIFCGFFLLVGAIAAVIQQTKMVGILNDTFNPVRRRTLFGQTSSFSYLGPAYFISLLVMMLGYVAIAATVFSYMSLYREKGNVPPTTEEIWGYLKYFYFRLLGAGFVQVIVLSIGFVLCIIPGIYLYPILALIYPIIIFENASFGYAFNKSFRLIKDNWWVTFGSLVVIVIIVYFASAIVVLPTTIINFSGLLLHPGKGAHLSLVLTIISTVLQHIIQLLYAIPLIAVALCYFSLSEQTESTGLLARINKLGDTRADDTLPKEEY